MREVAKQVCKTSSFGAHYRQCPDSGLSIGCLYSICIVLVIYSLYVCVIPMQRCAPASIRLMDNSQFQMGK